MLRNRLIFLHLEIQMTIDRCHLETLVLFVENQNGVVRLIEIILRQELLNSVTSCLRFDIPSKSRLIFTYIFIQLSLIEILSLFHKHKFTRFLGSLQQFIFLNWHRCSGRHQRIIINWYVLNFLFNLFFTDILW